MHLFILFSSFQLLYYSAHYPTMLSLFTSLGLIKDSQSPLSKIPNYASLVFIELLRDSKNKYFVQFSFKNSSLEVSLFSLYVYGNHAFSLE